MSPPDPTPLATKAPVIPVLTVERVADAVPLAHIRFCPTGGIDARNAGEYLALANVVSVGGSWPAPKELIASGDFSRVTALAFQVVRSQAVRSQEVRSQGVRSQEVRSQEPG